MHEPEPDVVYTRRAEWVSPVDGDSFFVRLDHGRFPVTRSVDEPQIRVRDLYAPELGKPGGVEAAKFTHDLMAAAQRITVRTYRTRTGRTIGSFARVVADVWADGESVAEAVIAAGHGRATPEAGFTKPRLPELEGVASPAMSEPEQDPTQFDNPEQSEEDADLQAEQAPEQNADAPSEDIARGGEDDPAAG